MKTTTTRYNTGRKLCTPLLFGLCVIVLSGCPAEETSTGEGGTGETGDPPPAEALDPFEGQGSDPPGDPDPDAEWVSSSTLGNGLVYDTRFDIAAQGNTYEKDVTGMDLTAGIGWSSFVTAHATKVGGGLRPTAVDADVSLTATPAGGLTLGVNDRSTYMADDESNYRHEVRTYIFGDPGAELALAQSGAAQPGQPRPISIDTFVVPTDGSIGDSIVWVYDNNPVPWKIVAGEGGAVFPTTVDDLAAEDYRPISVASRSHNGASEYSAIFVEDGVPVLDGRLDLGLDWSTIAAAAAAAWDAGFYPVRGSYEQGSAALPLFNVLWARRSPELALEMRYNLDQALFDSEDVNRRSQGYSLENATMYQDGGQERFAGVWVRHEPTLRQEIGDSYGYEDLDPTFVARYEIFQDKLIQSMTLAGEQKEGEYFRSSATLHIWEGDNLVINRAYTYAPSIYPDTPLDATMAVASVSKSITAAAVVKVLAANNNVPLTVPFDIATGIVNWPGAPPSVAQVLGNVGGFVFGGDARNYFDHKAISDLGWGALPIDEQELASYAVGEGLLDGPNNTDNYWESSKVGSYIYSNPGFSMLGELVRVQSGVSYEEYVSTMLLGPVNLDDEIFADRGNRNVVDVALVSGDVPLGQFQPLRSALRTYLINTSHPYVCTAIVTACTQEIPPVDSSPGPTTVKWRPNVAPSDASTPDTAVKERYAGSIFLGGAPLAAGGWQADGQSLGQLIRIITQSSLLMPANVASQLWAPQSLQFQVNVMEVPAFNWAYGLGWYVRGNWVAWAGGTAGASALVLHNMRYDFTVVILTNITGNGINDLWSLFNPVCSGDVANCWDTSTLGALFPCWDDPNTVADECPVEVIY